VAQRITARYHLLPLSEPETSAYIRHRIEVAGRPDLLQPTEAIFSAPAMRQIHRLAGGVPRLINVVCDRALLGAYANDTDRVDAAMARRAAREVLGRGPWRMRAWWWIAAPAIAAAVIGGLWILSTPGALERLGRLGRAAMPAASRSPAAPPGGETSAPERSAPPTGSAPTAAAGIEPDAGSAAPAPPATRLADLLGDRSLPSDRASALASLYARWYPGETPGSTVGSGCESGRLAGLDCRARTGTWTKLRRLNLPAVIQLMGSDGEPHYAALTGLDRDRAMLEIGGKPFTFPLAEIDPLWDGAFILLWKAPPVSLSLLGPGTRGKDVEWLSQRLRAIEGRPPEGRRSDVYDDELKTRVMAFQRSRSLLPDGIVGEETLFQLTTAVPDPSRPFLSRPGRSE
jgi:general secretion pathway protein A